jgi:DNA-binding transcriptional regulator YhcF (GntR family)
MRLWLNRDGTVSLRDQLRTQIALSILCGEMTPGQRLPSTRDLARRYGIHANTASATYRQLEAQGWLEFRHGSGVFVRGTRPDSILSTELKAQLAPTQAIDGLLAEFLSKARALNAPEALIRSRLRTWLARELPSRWLVVEPEPELRRILVFEMKTRMRMPVSGCSPEDLALPGFLDGAMPVALPNRAEAVRAMLPAELPLHVVLVHPVGPSLESYLPVREGALIGIVSRWKEFQRIAQVMLTAAGVPPTSLLVRDAVRPGWRRGLEQASALVCDAATEPLLPKGVRLIPYRLLSEASILQFQQVEAALGSEIPFP